MIPFTQLFDANLTTQELRFSGKFWDAYIVGQFRKIVGRHSFLEGFTQKKKGVELCNVNRMQENIDVKRLKEAPTRFISARLV